VGDDRPQAAPLAAEFVTTTSSCSASENSPIGLQSEVLGPVIFRMARCSARHARQEKDLATRSRESKKLFVEDHLVARGIDRDVCGRLKPSTGPECAQRGHVAARGRGNVEMIRRRMSCSSRRRVRRERVEGQASGPSIVV